MAEKYDFDEIIDRRGTDSVKWDLAQDPEVLPMWVADMDFRTAPEITEALINKVSGGLFGYGSIPENFYESIIGWWRDVHHFTVRREWILAGPGMIPTLSAIVRTFLKPGESMIIQPPVYNHFFTVIENCGMHLVKNNLIFENGDYKIDFEDLETKAADPGTKLLLLCNPHNPVGKAWQKKELEKIAEICSRHEVMVVSDEIHADLVLKGHQHHPFVGAAEGYALRHITCGSPCKTFNLASLPIAYSISPDLQVLERIRKTLEMQETAYPNPLAAEALIAAYTNGRAWLEELKDYLAGNFEYLQQFCTEYLPEVLVIPLQATYLVWLDCSALNEDSAGLTKILLDEEKLWLNPGTMYGESGEGFIRINIACPRELLSWGLSRLRNYRNRKVAAGS
ncbi:MalY/PatB family protein [Chryseobacterium sp.]|uniref:MalY/PatB family protein n=1 Tax=Chryseobacterium sp. TaxID=1871047 RepID=UPI0011C6F7AA|nr:MalY/PatB family protein [Chryseobacterium sp.]TXF79478.1 pyridoxal phosphate-dependent aminotransferase [Chryseobacterium sp.]